jgi:glycosyltransferase involved in cell wall biosynthesis
MGEEKIRQKIADAGMNDHVILLGKKENPYSYIKACDIYVQPSRYEGKSVTVREAQVLCKPVIVTDYPTAKSQIKDGIDGVIVPMDNEGCAQGIAMAIENQPLLDKLTEYLESHDYGNESEVNKIYALM